MKVRPILFNGPMVCALLNGSKTQTRRPIKLSLERTGGSSGGWSIVHKLSNIAVDTFNALRGRMGPKNPTVCPYGEPGDQLWVRETWAYEVNAIGAARDEDGPFVYAADGAQALQRRLCERWRPSIHMPRCANRILLEVVSVRIERLQAITETDARAEGVHKFAEVFMNGMPGWEGFDGALPRPTATSAFVDLWESSYGQCSWDLNPWVWVVEFRRVMP